MTDWVAWHDRYADPGSDVSRRRRSVQASIHAWLDGCDPSAAVRVVSACAGDGRDLLEVLATRSSPSVRARLVELDEELAASAAAYAVEHGLDVEVVRGDAGRTDSYAGAVPADLVLMCGVFGNVTDDDIRATVALLPAFCAPGATVVWTRGRFESGDLTPQIRGWFGEARFDEVSFDAPDDTIYSVGVHRLVGDPRPLPEGRTFFTFVR